MAVYTTSVYVFCYCNILRPKSRSSSDTTNSIKYKGINTNCLIWTEGSLLQYFYNVALQRGITHWIAHFTTIATVCIAYCNCFNYFLWTVFVVQHYKIIVKPSPRLRYGNYYVFTLYCTQLVVPDDDLLLGRNMLQK